MYVCISSPLTYARKLHTYIHERAIRNIDFGLSFPPEEYLASELIINFVGKSFANMTKVSSEIFKLESKWQFYTNNLNFFLSFPIYFSSASLNFILVIFISLIMKLSSNVTYFSDLLMALAKSL